MYPKVSVIVPIYNAEKYLRQCLSSLKAQTLQDVEFILIDDCSTDNSYMICNEFSTSDNRFRVVHREKNGGSSAARQTGLTLSVGEYVIICDADDWVEPAMYELLYENAKYNDSDISVCDYYLYYEEDGTQKQVSNKLPNGTKEDMVKATLTQKFPPASWVKLVRREFIIKNGVNYEEGINMGEDYLILVKMVLLEPKITKINVPLYHYRKVKSGDSYTNRPSYSLWLQYRSVYNWFVNNLDNILYGRELVICAINVAYLGLRIHNIPVEEHRAFIHSSCKLSEFIKYHIFSVKAFLILLCKISVPLAVFLNKKIRKYCNK